MKRRIRLCKGEKFLYTTAIICFFIAVVTNVFGAIQVGDMSFNVEILRRDINIQKNRNESLVMKVNELTSFDTIKEVVKEMGLAYNNDNIIIISE